MSVTYEHLIQALHKIGICKGDTIFVHSDLRAFGHPQDIPQERSAILHFYYDALQSIIGPEGTLAVPAYFYEYAKQGLPFDIDSSPVSSCLGSFSQWINTLPHRVRSCNPLQSIAAIGSKATALAGSNSLSGYGVTSPWHHLRLMDGKILFLGAPVQSMTYVHYIEQQYGVPHLYFKSYPYPIYKNGFRLSQSAISAVRYLDFSVNYSLSAFEKKLHLEGAMLSTHIQNVHPSACLKIVTAQNAFTHGIQLLDQNPYAFLASPPIFTPGQIPIDGITYPLS